MIKFNILPDKYTAQMKYKSNTSQHKKEHSYYVNGCHYIKRGKAERFLPKIWNKTRISTFATFIQHISGRPSQRNQAEVEKAPELEKK